MSVIIKQTNEDDLLDGDIGRLLNGSFSAELKARVSMVVDTLRKLELLNPLNIPYLAAWKEDRKIIWYEFIGSRLCTLLGCNKEQAADAFRQSVIDRRVYRYEGADDFVEEEILTREELSDYRQGLREEGKESGSVDAVYKIETLENRVVWLKDQARIENFSSDHVCLSLGFLTDVTKEMEQKDLFEKIGYFDELTRLPKRLIMQRIFEINIGQYCRSHIENFVFMMIDVDHFKSVNDTFGHQAGDFVLISMAELMLASKRKEDEIGRYGGEEFYGFSLGSIEHGIFFAERLRKRIEQHCFVYQGQEISVTISIGVAAASHVVEEGVPTSENLLELADKRLYQAKQGGRNRVAWQD